MILGAAYSFFDGEELLRYSIKSIRGAVDYITVVAQDISYLGNPWTREAHDLCTQLLSDGVIDSLVMYEAKPGMTPQEQEVRKRNIGLAMCRKAGCTHIMTLDADEFYVTHELERAKKLINTESINIAYCNFYMYYKYPIFKCVSIPLTKVSFVQKIGANSSFILGESSKYDHIALTDPTRTTNIGHPVKLYKEDIIAMHHMCHVRKDSLVSKFRNTVTHEHYSTSGLGEKLIREYKAWSPVEVGGISILKPTEAFSSSIVEVDNVFGIAYDW